MIIEIQEKKINIEIFGELPLDSSTLKKHLKLGRGVGEPVKVAEPIVKPIIEDEASNEQDASQQKKWSGKSKTKKRKRSSSQKKGESERKMNSNLFQNLMKSQLNWSMKANLQRQQQNLML